MADHHAPAAEERADPKDAAKKKGGGKMFLMVFPAIFLVSLVGGGWIAFSNYETVAKTAALVSRGLNTELPEAPDPEGEHGKKKKKHDGEEGEEAPGVFTQLEGLVINPSDSQGRRYLLLNIGMETDEHTVEVLKTQDIVIRDTIVRLLGEHSVAQLSDVSQREALKDTLVYSINELLPEGEIQRLYFTQFVLQ
jgi:flagellar FliL protein